jgi:glycosyltransferase involved in cell wall biosynthesis
VSKTPVKVKRIAYACKPFGSPDRDRCESLFAISEDVCIFDWSAQTVYKWSSLDDCQIKRNIYKVNNANILQITIFVIRFVLDVLKFNPDIAIFYGYNTLPFFVAASILRAVGRTVVSMNDSKFDDYDRSILKDLSKIILLTPYNGYLAASRRAEQYLRYLGAKNIYLYYCAIDVGKVKRNGQSEFVNTGFDERNFVVIARFVTKKNYPFILKSFESYSSSVANPRRLVLCGYGPLEAEIRSAIAASEMLSRYVDVVGYLRTDQIPELLGRSLALLLPSTEEQFGIVVTEALAVGIPVVISTCCGATDLINSTVNGYVVEPNNVAGLCSALVRLSSDPELWNQLSRNARQSAWLADTSVFVDALSSVASDRFVGRRNVGRQVVGKEV